MSRISESPHRKLQPSWKLSDNSRTNSKDNSISQNSFRLAEKFSPARRSNDPSPQPRSKQRIRLQKPHPSSPSPSPSRLPLTSALPAPVQPKLPSKMSTIESVQRGSGQNPIGRTQSSSSKLDLQSVLGREEGQLTRAALSQIKIEFANFKRIVLAELKSQRDEIARLGVELGRRVEEVARSVGQGGLEGLRESTQREVEKLAQQVESCPVLGEVKWSATDIKLKVEPTPSIQLDLAHQPQRFIPPLSLPVQQAIIPVELTDKKKQELPGETGRTDRADKSARTLQKCTQIAQTIGTLTEINSSPVTSKTKSIEKPAIEQYKQKLIARTNNQFQRDRSRGREPEENGRRFKMDKFYSAIEKLKEEVNEIRTINDMKVGKKDRNEP